jgi:hypothetical protein
MARTPLRIAFMTDTEYEAYRTHRRERGGRIDQPPAD